MALKRFIVIGFVATLLAACGDDSGSNSVTDSDEVSSSSVKKSCSSSAKAKSSSSKAMSSSSKAKSSSSKEIATNSSSSRNDEGGKSSSSDGSSSSSAKSSLCAASSSSKGVELGEKSSSSSVASSSSILVEYVAPSTVVKGTMTDERDGQTYKTVKIGSQTWMAENLNYETGRSFCYNDSIEYCAKYGRLYVWDAALNACPDGWHLPMRTEWKTLITAVGDSSTAGKMLRSTSGWISPKGDNRNGTDEYAFTALPAGIRFDDGDFRYDGINALFWGSTESDGNYAYSVELYCGVDGASMYGNLKGYGFSVRCVKD